MCQAAMDLAQAVESIVRCQLANLKNMFIIYYIQHCGSYRTRIEATSPDQEVFRRCQTLSWDLCPVVAFA